VGDNVVPHSPLPPFGKMPLRGVLRMEYLELRREIKEGVCGIKEGD